MGQAKLRGTFEERKAESIDKKRQEYERNLQQLRERDARLQKQKPMIFVRHSTKGTEGTEESILAIFK
jgi:hypothetical protein